MLDGSRMPRGSGRNITNRKLTLSCCIVLVALVLVFAACSGLSGAVEHFDAGLKLQVQGHFEEAIGEYDQTIELDPEYAMAYNNRGLAYGDLGQLEKAIKDYDRAIELNPRFATTFYNRALAYNDLGQYQQAVEDYDRAIERDPRFATAFASRALAYTMLGKDDEALADLERAVALGEDRAVLEKMAEEAKGKR